MTEFQLLAADGITSLVLLLIASLTPGTNNQK